MAAPEVEFEDGRMKLKAGFAKLVRILESEHEPGYTTQEYIGLYTVVYNMCTGKPPLDFSDLLYKEYGELVNGYVDEKVVPSLNKKHGEFLLREIEKRWTHHKVMLRWLSRFFEYLERYHIPRKNLPTLKDISCNCFREKVYGEIKVQVKDVILSLIGQEREGEQIDRSVMKNVLSMVADLGDNKLSLYTNYFETYMLENTVDYYSRKSSKHIAEDSCANYLLMAEESLRKEKERATSYLHSSSEPKLVEKTQHVLLFVPANQILEKVNSGLDVLLRDSKMEDLSRMFRLFSKVENGLEQASVIFKKHVTSTGVELIKETEDAITSKKAESKGNTSSQEQVYVNKVIQLHSKYLSICKDCFNSTPLFHKVLKEGFELFFNKEIAGMTSAEMFSSFCDSFLQKGSAVEKLGEDAIEETIEKVVELLAYLHDKDLFSEFSRKKLARRLLCDRSSNVEHEKVLLTKLKQQCGTHFTSKMEGMITDLTLAKDIQLEFQNYIRDNKEYTTQGIDVSVTVLTTGFWPAYKTLDFNIPAEFFLCLDAFKRFYKWKANNRKLTWIFSLGNCTVTGNFDKKRIELLVSTYQAATLLLFNTTDRLSFQQIANELKLPREEIVRVLHSLSCGRHKILIKEPESKVVSPSDIFVYNSKFTDKMKRIKVPLPHLEEKKKVIEDVDKDRKFSIDAAIVRIMKSRKVLPHQQLVMECVQILSRMFKPDIKVIKKRIEDLINREFLARDEENRNLYKYLA